MPSPLVDRYALEEGTIFLTGVQALVRTIIDQRRADQRRGVHTAAFISGYRGSPLAGLDTELDRAAEIAASLEITHLPALNEELAATSVFGTQLVAGRSTARYEGVTGYWYGKAPGLDRAGDAIRHANLAGTSALGGAVAFVGDDPTSKSSTIPCASETALAALGLPVLYPGSLQDTLDLGRHAVALSRASGLWSSLKIVTAVADGLGTASVGSDRAVPVLPASDGPGRPFAHRVQGILVPPHSLELERSLWEVRLPLAVEYARANALNPITVSGPSDRLGIVSAGKAYGELRQALADLGLDDGALHRAGVRILKLGLIHPLDRELVRRFARGLEMLVVVEDKGPFIEQALAAALYGMPDQPRLYGKDDPDGRPFLAAAGELEAPTISDALRPQLEATLGPGRLRPAPAPTPVRVALAPTPLRTDAQVEVARAPFFCSGCPHNRSTLTPDGELVGAGIGCHTMVVFAPERRGDIVGVTQMGGEGAQWFGMAPYVDEAHLTQNIGDGTLFHSGSLAIRAAVAAGASMTFKILYNGHVSMTGGQDAEGGMPVPELTALLEVEGVARTIVTTDDPGRYREATLAANAEVRHRDQLLSAQRELVATPGVTVLIHDQECSAELRRLRKRGKAVDPVQRIAINERVCEGCGDCGRASSCLSVVPVDTELGRKTQIHQASCNKDYSCLDGDCPSFLTITPGTRATARVGMAPPLDLPAPTPPAAFEGERTVRLVGIGGTGVVTVSQVLGMAAMLDGRHVWGLDQTGLSQKAGPVVSDLRIASGPIDGANKPSPGQLDLYLGFDLLGAADPKHLRGAGAARTVAVVSTTATATGSMVLDHHLAFPDLRPQLDRIEDATRADQNVYLDAGTLSEQLFGSNMQANVLVLGAAVQRGLLPVGLERLEEAFRVNGTAVDQNLAALAWGRACVAAPELVDAAVRPPELPVPEVGADAWRLIDDVPAAPELRRLLTVRVPDLIGYQDHRYAARYVRFVTEVAHTTAHLDAVGELITEAVARGLHKLMAYKDEYEVARLHLDPVERERIRRAFGEDAKVAINLHPPALRAIGLTRKLQFGPRTLPALRALRAMRRVRGHWYDPFGWMAVRRTERHLVQEYQDLVRTALEGVDPVTAPDVLALCELPDLVRGYEDIKLANVEAFRAAAAERLAAIQAIGTPAG